MTTPTYDRVYAEYLALSRDPAWRMAFEIALGEWMGQIATYHQGPIQAIADRAVIRNLNATRDDITKSFLLTRLEEIRKERIFRESDVVRDAHGRFADEHRGSAQGVYNARHEDALGRAIGSGMNLRTDASRERYQGRQDRQGQATAVMQQRMAELADKAPSATPPRVLGRRDALGLMTAPVTFPAASPADHKAQVLTEAARLTYALEDKTLKTGDRQRIQYTITGPRGTRVETPSAGYIPDNIDWDNGERIQYMAPIGADHPASVAGKVMDVGLVAGADPDTAAKMGSVVSDIRDTMNTTDWGKRLALVANVGRVVSNGHPVAAQAHAVATMVDLLGPDAARAFGPKMRQLSYRYTGQEAGKGQMSDIARGGRNVDSKGQLESIEGFENRLVLDLAKDLPRATEYKAALQAGSTPPSKGYLLDKNGKVVSEAVGFADDWYTPFNLKRLPKLAHGSYVRTRGYGGLTPEDIQLALHTGAQRVTVVSNSGVFTIEFDDRARQPGHRFGFGGTSMYRRYTKSLDAIKHGNVAGSDGNLQLDQRGYAIALKDLKNKYPYFVKSVTVLNPVNAAATGTGESVSGTPERQKPDEGYVRPLSVRASGAKSGLADPAVEGQKQAYDQLEAYQLRAAQFGALQRKHGAAETTTSATKPAPTSAPKSFAEVERAKKEAEARQAAEARGEGTSVSAYATGTPMQPSDVGQELAQLRRVIQQDVKGEAEDVEVQQLIAVLGAGERKGDRGYDEVFKRYQTDEGFRTRVYDALSDVYAGHELTGTILPNLMGQRVVAGTSDDNPDAPDDMEPLDPEEDYNEDSNIPKAVLDSSLAVRHWKARKAAEAEYNPLAKRRREAFDWYQNISEGDLRNGNQNGRNGLNPEQRAAYDSIHREIAGLVNAERRGDYDPADYEDDEPKPAAPPRPKAPVDPEAASRQHYAHVREIITSDDAREAAQYGHTIVDELINGENDLSPEQSEAAIRRTITSFRDYERKFRQDGNENYATLMDAAITGMRDFARDTVGLDVQ